MCLIFVVNSVILNTKCIWNKLGIPEELRIFDLTKTVPTTHYLITFRYYHFKKLQKNGKERYIIYAKLSKYKMFIWGSQSTVLSEYFSLSPTTDLNPKNSHYPLQ